VSESSHWPFESHGAKRGIGRSGKLQGAKARAAQQAMFRQRARHDRLIVGGRAHSKKSGLS
jgi:hypothetical protein